MQRRGPPPSLHPSARRLRPVPDDRRVPDRRLGRRRPDGVPRLGARRRGADVTANGWLQIGFYFVVLLVLTKPLGAYMFRAFETDDRPWPSVLGRLECLCLRLCGVDP